MPTVSHGPGPIATRVDFKLLDYQEFPGRVVNFKFFTGWLSLPQGETNRRNLRLGVLFARIRLGEIENGYRRQDSLGGRQDRLGHAPALL